MSTEQMRKLIDLFETKYPYPTKPKDPNVDYSAEGTKGEVSKVIATLRGKLVNDSLELPKMSRK